jgi:hypothetical protein
VPREIPGEAEAAGDDDAVVSAFTLDPLAGGLKEIGYFHVAVTYDFAC